MKQYAVMFEQLAGILNKNIPLVQAFKLLTTLSIDTNFHQMISNITQDLQNGVELSVAIGKNIPKIDKFVINILSIGTRANQLVKCLMVAATYLNNQLQQRSKIAKQLIYPTITIATAVLIILLMQHLILPNIISFYKTINAQIPSSISNLILIINCLEFFMLIFFLMLLFFLIFKKKLPKFKLFIQKIVYKMPIIKTYIKLNFCYSFCFSIEMLLKCHQSLNDCLEQINAQQHWLQHKDLITYWLRQINFGVKLSDAMQATSYIPHFMVKFIAIGEHSGDLVASFEYLNKYFNGELSEFYSKINHFLEPFIVLSLGIIIGIITICIYYPIFQLSSSL
jgi:type IV pilus assembly protein PilC